MTEILPDPDSDIVKSVRLEISIYKYIEGNNHVRASRIAERLGVKPKSVSQVFKLLERDGEVSKWSNNAPHTWEIEL